MCAGTGLLTVTFSDGCLQMLLAVIVQITSPPGTTLPTGTSLVVFSPLASIVTCSVSATDFSTMQPAARACANAGAPTPDARMAAKPKNLSIPMFMNVSFTANFLLIDHDSERDRLGSA